MQKKFLTAEQVDQVLEAQRNSASRFGEIAYERGWLSTRQLAQLLAWQQEEPKQLAAILIRTGLLSPEQTTAALQSYYDSVHAAQANEVAAV